MSSHQPSQEQVLAWLDEACGEGRAPMFVRSAVQEVVGKAVAWAAEQLRAEGERAALENAVGDMSLTSLHTLRDAVDIAMWRLCRPTGGSDSNG